jgi:putative hydrolase of the HAD superfamily
MRYVLDLDDTLYLERDFVHSGYRAVDQFLRDQCFNTNFFEFAWEHFLSKNYCNIISRFINEMISDIQDKMLLEKRLIEIYRNHQPVISLCSDAIEFLNKYKQDSLALITDGYSQTQWNKIDALGIRTKIGEIIVTDDWGREFWKPHHRAFRFAGRQYLNRDCVYIGDNPEKDFIAPKELDWATSIRIRRSGSLHAEIDTPPFCHEIISLTEIIGNDVL